MLPAGRWPGEEFPGSRWRERLTQGSRWMASSPWWRRFPQVSACWIRLLDPRSPCEISRLGLRCSATAPTASGHTSVTGKLPGFGRGCNVRNARKSRSEFSLAGFWCFRSPNRKIPAPPRFSSSTQRVVHGSGWGPGILPTLTAGRNRHQRCFPLEISICLPVRDSASSGDLWNTNL